MAAAGRHNPFPHKASLEWWYVLWHVLTAVLYILQLQYSMYVYCVLCVCMSLDSIQFNSQFLISSSSLLPSPFPFSPQLHLHIPGRPPLTATTFNPMHTSTRPHAHTPKRLPPCRLCILQQATTTTTRQSRPVGVRDTSSLLHYYTTTLFPTHYSIHYYSTLHMHIPHIHMHTTLHTDIQTLILYLEIARVLPPSLAPYHPPSYSLSSPR